MAKATIVRDNEGRFYGIKILCPACRWPDGKAMLKVLPVTWLPAGETEESPHVAGMPHWSFNGDFEKPVLGPSVLQWWGEEGSDRYRRCHSFIGCNGAQPGQITFLSDCSHALAGQTVDLPDTVDGDE
ncbi:hypothetical protein ACTJK4_14170 [Ralstonia sp. 22111]|uniref:hypothetical protein n=1 Tax=Ralstonia sp. 22111 TaxID=3453878 RepID=UPI003F82FE53